VVSKEINLRGTFRFHEEFAWAVEILAARSIDVRPLLTEVVPLADAARAFELAADRSRAMKVQVAL
jgi:L-idonate 5-dehydrogenase